jgi:hypothetical protein
MNTHTLPALRAGQPYDSLEKTELKSVRSGEAVATVSQVNAGLIRRDLRKVSRQSLQEIPIARLIEIYAEAGELFLNGTVGGLSPQDYIDALSETSGLPHALVRRNMGKIHQVFTELPTILNGLTRGLPLDVLDTGYGEQAGVPVSYFPTTDALGVVLPSNSPGVNSLWLPALALKTPVVLKPGREEPWTPLRIVQSLVAAGIPADAFYFYPTDHEGSAAVMDACGKALIFGDQSTVERYASNPNVEVHGPGWSKVVIGDDQIERWPDFLDLLAASIADNGGRSCINASAVLVPKHGAEIAEALGRKLAEIAPRSPTDPDATLSGFANPKMAEWMDSAIDEGLETPGAEDVTARYRAGERRAERDGSTYLLPTLVHCESFSHPLANREFLFPYASLIELPQEQMVEQMGPSLVVTALTEDKKFLSQLLASPHIERLNIGPIPTTKVEWNQPHEGNLFEFLYRRRSLQWAPNPTAGR